jgi:hypothetical protein
LNNVEADVAGVDEILEVTQMSSIWRGASRGMSRLGVVLVLIRTGGNHFFEHLGELGDT